MKDGNVVTADKLVLFPPPVSKMKQGDIIKHVAALFFDEDAPHRAELQKSDIVLIENQMKSKMLQIQQVIATFLHCKGIPFKFVSPRSVNVHFKIGRKFRGPLSGNKLVRERKHYLLNKSDSIKLGQKRFPRLFAALPASKKDDVADAVKQALWYTETEGLKLEKKRKKEEASAEKKRKREVAAATKASKKKKTKKTK